MEYRRCQPPCSRCIASDDPTRTVNVLNVWVFRMRWKRFMASRNANSAKTLRTRHAVFERELSVFPHRAPEAAEAFREFTTWGSDVELEVTKSEQTSLAFSLPLSPAHVCVNSPVEFTHEYLCPSPEARDAVSFGLDDVLFTAASDSEDFRPALADALPPSSQEARPTPSSRTCYHAPLKSSPTSPANL